MLFKGVHYETIVETRAGTSITVKMNVSEDNSVYNVRANERMSANDFYLDAADVDELTEADIIARADAQAWNPETDEFVSINKVEYKINKQTEHIPLRFQQKLEQWLRQT